jgi:Carboxypeptidase regulatory-like domain
MANSISGSAGGVNGANVTLEGRTATGRVFVNGAADSSGNFTFSGLAAGTYTLRAQAPGYGFNQVSVVLAAADQSNVNLTAIAISAGPTALDANRSPNGR